MDEMGEIAVHLPAARHSAFFWRGTPSVIGAQLRPGSKDNIAAGKARRYSSPVEGQAAGQAASEKRRRASKADI